MSDILIKGMKMPKSCADCPLTHICPIDKEQRRKGNNIRSLAHREYGCILEEVPTHGELIDKEALEKELFKAWEVDDDQDFANKSVWRNLKEAPVIVEASR